MQFLFQGVTGIVLMEFLCAIANSSSVVENVSTISPSRTINITAPTSTVEPTTPPTTTPTEEPTDTKSITAKVNGVFKITNVNFDDVQNETSPAGIDFRSNFCKNVMDDLKELNSIKCEVTGVSRGSVVVSYILTVSAPSAAEFKNVVNAIQEAVKSGKIGNYTVDPTYPTNVHITLKASDLPVPATTDPSLTHFPTVMLYGIGFGLLFLLLVLAIVLIIVIVCLCKRIKKQRIVHDSDITEMK